MTSSPLFQMTIQNVTSIQGTRGTICRVTGRVERGSLSFGDEVFLLQQGVCVRRIVVPCIESPYRRFVDRAARGEIVSLYLPEMLAAEVKQGDVLLGIQADASETSRYPVQSEWQPVARYSALR